MVKGTWFIGTLAFMLQYFHYMQQVLDHNPCNVYQSQLYFHLALLQKFEGVIEPSRLFVD